MSLHWHWELNHRRATQESSCLLNWVFTRADEIFVFLLETYVLFFLPVYFSAKNEMYRFLFPAMKSNVAILYMLLSDFYQNEKRIKIIIDLQVVNNSYCDFSHFSLI